MASFKTPAIVLSLSVLFLIAWWIWHTKYRFRPLPIHEGTTITYSVGLSDDPNCRSTIVKGVLATTIIDTLTGHPIEAGYYHCPLDTARYLILDSMDGWIYILEDRLMYQDSTGYREWKIPGIETELNRLLLENDR